MRTLLFLLCCLGSTITNAQIDDYTQDLITFLNTQYTLEGEAFPFYNNEQAMLSNAGGYGGTFTSGTATGQDFELVQTMNITTPGANPWDAGWSISSTQDVHQGDKVLIVVYLRAAPTANGDATARLDIVTEHNQTYEKEAYIAVELTETWRRFFIPLDINQHSFYPAGRLNFGFHLGHRAQTVQMGGLAIFNYGDDIPFDQLPFDIGADDYGGFEDDAPWRQAAADRIEQLRKADMTVRVVGTNGEALPSTSVTARMQRHEFLFGTSIKGCRFPGGRCYNATWNDKITNLDGKGHGFNALAPENDLKWNAWEQEWVTTREQTLRVLEYLHGEGIIINGHVLLWPGWLNLPDRMEDNADDPEFLVGEVRDHLYNFLETLDLDRWVTEWDVLNEVTTNTDLAAALAGTPGYVDGREIYAETFKIADSLAPDANLHVNDYVTLSLKNTATSPLYQQYQALIQEMLDRGAPIDVIGFQSHIGSSPNSIYDVLETLDDFQDKFGLKAKITEYDLAPNMTDDLAARYTRDFMTATFSHPSVFGFITWNFWDVDTWANPSANLYNADWSETPVHDTYVGLVFDEWWTEEEQAMTDAEGEATLRGFKGEYELEIECDDATYTRTVNLTQDQRMTFDCAEMALTGNREEELPVGSVVIAPNPGSGPITVTNQIPARLEAELVDANGRRVWSGSLPVGETIITTPLAAGAYVLRATDGRRSTSVQLVRK